MKVGILTFHWGANHGAVLQTYATQKYLEDNYDINVSVIDYYPKNQEITLKNVIKTKRFWLISNKIKKLHKDKQISGFRKKLNLTERYYSNKQLIDNPPDVDLLLCGSDQIWNPSYAILGEGKNTPVYFLNFGRNGCKKAALSASFGCTEYPQNAENIVKPFLFDLDAISVREESGISILRKMGIENAVITADPTALLSAEHYLQLCKDIPALKNDYTALCILRKQNKKVKNIITDLIKQYGNSVVDIESVSMENWISGIRDAKVVITNSFHCVMMCLKLHTPFVVVAETGKLSGMNDRLYTLLNKFAITDCIKSKGMNSNVIDPDYFEWDKIDIIMREYASTLESFLGNVVGGKNE